MTRSLSRRLVELPTLLLALAAVLMLAVTVLPAPAHAHDTLIATDPEDGATLETSPEELTLTFSADVLDVSPVVRISAEDGTLIEEITPVIEGPNAIAAPSEPLRAGTHDIQWRVVSSDGHPIEGTFSITIEQEAAPAPTQDATTAPEATAEAASEPTTEPAETSTGPAETADEVDEPAEEDGNSSMTLLLVIIGVAVLGVALAAVFALRRRR